MHHNVKTSSVFLGQLCCVIKHDWLTIAQCTKTTAIMSVPAA